MTPPAPETPQAVLERLADRIDAYFKKPNLWYENKAEANAILRAVLAALRASSVNILEVIVNGQPVTVKAGTVRAVIAEAIHVSGQIGAPVAQWELRTTDGEIIPHNVADGTDYELAPGHRLWLNLGLPALRASEGPREVEIVMPAPCGISGRLGIGAKAWAELLETEQSQPPRCGIALTRRTFETVMNALRHCGEKHYLNPSEAEGPREPVPCLTCGGRGWVMVSFSKDLGNGIGAGGSWNAACPTCRPAPAMRVKAPPTFTADLDGDDNTVPAREAEGRQGTAATPDPKAANMLHIVDGSERWYCRVEGCDEFTTNNVAFGRCAMHALEHLGGAEQPGKGFPPIGTPPTPRQFTAASSPEPNETRLEKLPRYERDVENRVGGHYGEEQWTESVMRPCETGAWVKWSDVRAALQEAQHVD